MITIDCAPSTVKLLNKLKKELKREFLDQCIYDSVSLVLLIIEAAKNGKKIIVKDINGKQTIFELKK